MKLSDPGKSSIHFAFGLVATAILAISPSYAQIESAATPSSASVSSEPDATSAATPNVKDESDTSRNEASTAKSTLSKSDANFLEKAAMRGILEVKLGNLAKETGSTPEVKEVGAMMVKDHSKANTELTALAGKKSLKLPTELDEKHQSKHDSLAKLSGVTFDKAYVKEMNAAHEKDVTMFKKQSEKSDDADVKAFAVKTLPTLEMHLEHLKKMSGK